MSLLQTLAIGKAADQLSREITRTDEVSVTRSTIATATGAVAGAAATGAIATAASAVGATTLAAVAAPVTVPLAVASAGVAFLCSLFD